MADRTTFVEPEDIYRWRKEFGISMAEYAREAGVHPVTAEIVLSKRLIKQGTYDKYFAALERLVTRKRDLYNHAADVLADHGR